MAETCTDPNHAWCIRHGVPCYCAITTAKVGGQLVDCTVRQAGDLAGLRRERDSLAARIQGGEHGLDRPELRARLAVTDAIIGAIEDKLVRA